MRISEALTPSLTGWMALSTLLGYIAVYAVVFGAGVYYLRRVIVDGLDPIERQTDDPAARPKRPLSALETPLDRQPAPARS